MSNQAIQMLTPASADHHSIETDWLPMAAISLAGAHCAEKSVSGENPHAGMIPNPRNGRKHRGCMAVKAGRDLEPTSSMPMSSLCGNLPAMLPQTFCHIPGIGATKEARLWAAGCHSWEQADASLVKFPPQRQLSFQQFVEKSQHELAQGNAEYFGSCLPSCEQWRLYREFRE